MVASSILETLSMRSMVCLSIVYVYKECFNFIYVTSSDSKRLVPLVCHNAAQKQRNFHKRKNLI
ncbi:uncharacterized protein LOC122529059 [Frieseomelitta varia]|uniref:uncharacterized protein LOC122529059 n=1 Tax=Frieseomelitta varia TaxID=561572 RepID=UPI001CB687DA|nr:uncharacterized protein LOC122529059 [Frieseomelitta varia]